MSRSLPVLHHGLWLHSVRPVDSISAAAAGPVPRKIYRYSVVPGGVYSAAEFDRARRMDPVVAAHYVGFGPKVSTTKLNKDMYVYVSYRKANHVYWSTKKHKVCEGETVVTDGKNMARGRCGNLLSFVPYHPSLDIQEPHERDLNTEEPLLAKLPEGPLFSPGYPGATTPEQYPGGSPGVAAPYATPARTGAASPFAAPNNFLGPLGAGGIGAPFLAVTPPADNTPGGGTPGGGPPGVPGGGETPVPEPQNALLFLLAAAGGGLLLTQQRKASLR
ncbi:MAG TPA: hypothetical protein VK493_14470 [Bryobacteraceae bacterium]|nr:hypothetical protein [Bryobacteraceae bacterium]